MVQENNSFNDLFLQQEYSSLVKNMLAFIGARRENYSRIRRFESNFGGDKLSINIDDDLIDYLWGFHSKTPEYSPIFDIETISKWKIVTIFACGKYVCIKTPEGPALDLVVPTLMEKEHYSSLAALAGFPLLENIARKISKKWDNQGRTVEELNKELYNLSHTYKVGSTISSFKDKMKVMILSMPKETQQEWLGFDKLTQQPDIKGIPYDPIPSLFERLHKRRNNWAHGQEFIGEEGILISLIIRFLYLNCVKFQFK